MTGQHTGWLCEAIEQYVVREEKREAFLQDGIRAWEEYQSTGLHVTMEEADAWLAKLESGQDVEPPECHVWYGQHVHFLIYNASTAF